MTWGTEAPTAFFTLVWFLTGMSHHMALQVTQPTKLPAALLTFIRFLTSVSPHMPLQTTHLTELFAAFITPIGLLTGMCPHVYLQLTQPTKLFVAILAPKGFLSVWVHVCLFMSLSRRNSLSHSPHLCVRGRSSPRPLLPFSFSRWDTAGVAMLSRSLTLQGWKRSLTFRKETVDFLKQSTQTTQLLSTSSFELFFMSASFQTTRPLTVIFSLKPPYN